MMVEFPRTILLSWQRPDGRLAGAELLRRMVSQWPPERLQWAYLSPNAPSESAPVPHRGFPPRELHWRLRRTVLAPLWAWHLQARSMARRMAAWVRPFRPERVWVLAERGAVTIGRFLARRLGIPLHVTVHDAFDFAQFTLPRSYYPFYQGGVRRLLNLAVTLDAVTPELLDHIMKSFSMPRLRDAAAIPPGIHPALMTPAFPLTDHTSDQRTLALCGTLRIDVPQWRRFLERLSILPFRFVIRVFGGWEERFGGGLPPNVRLDVRGYLATDQALIESLSHSGAWAGYVGLTERLDQQSFARYSLSSKLVAYTAAGLPVIVHGPEDAATWKLVAAYGAGIRVGHDLSRDTTAMHRLFKDVAWQWDLARGALRLCRAEFDLERHLLRLAELLRRSP